MPVARVALVTRRFWPLIGGPERLLAWLAEEFARRGISVTLLTAQWESHWPRALPLAGAHVVRLPQPNVRGWGTLRYLWSLGTWLRRHHHEFDAVIVSTLQYEAYVAQLALAGTRVPILLRADKGGPEGDCAWHESQRLGMRVRQSCQDADCVIAPGDDVADELLRAGFASERLEVVPAGVPEYPPRTSESRRHARELLADTHRDLQAGETTFVAAYIGHLTAAAGLFDLLRAWRKVVAVWPDARLWLIGEGADRYDLYDRVRDLHLQYHVVMPGAFDDIAELLPAVDVCVYPAHGGQSDLAILEAMAAEVPVIASDHAPHHGLLEHEIHGLLIPPRDSTALAEAIACVFTLRSEAEARARRARQWALANSSAARMANRYLEIMERLLAKKSLPLTVRSGN